MNRNRITVAKLENVNRDPGEILRISVKIVLTRMKSSCHYIHLARVERQFNIQYRARNDVNRNNNGKRKSVRQMADVPSTKSNKSIVTRVALPTTLYNKLPLSLMTARMESSLLGGIVICVSSCTEIHTYHIP